MMDKSFEYIEMCQKAEEIQSGYQLRPNDYYAYFKKGKSCILVYQRYRPLNRPEYQKIFLPRQDQLQAMIFSEIGLQTLCQAICDFSKTEYGSRFTICGSMEQLWLAFTMKEKFGKVWNGKDWNLEKTA